MTTIQNNVVINKPINEVYAFLSDLNNHEQLMPENIQDWTSTADDAKFSIKNMAKLVLKISERIENSEVVAIPSEKAPFDLKLAWKLEEVSVNETKATYVIEADLNMMMKMVASGPLQKLVDFEVKKLKEVLG